MNFVFISPNFPHTYWNFCDRLRRKGVDVFGIGDAAYDSLDPRLKESLREYYKVDSIGDYAQVFKAVAFFSYKYGKIDWIESNNEFWLETDARLRTDFHVTTGVGLSGIGRFKSKAAQKRYYAKGEVPTALQQKVSDIGAAEAFIAEVGYPVIVKPEIGVGAAATYKVSSAGELEAFFGAKPQAPYVMEEFITGDIYSYDAICDSGSRPLFESSARFPASVMDIVNQQLDMPYYVLPSVPDALRELGRRTLKAFEVKSRFVHFEFFRLTRDRKAHGRAGDFVGLETNMRPAGGYTPDMMNYAHSTDVYEIWADMVVSDRRLLPESRDDQYCIYYGRRDCHRYRHPHEEVMARYGAQMVMQERIPDALAPDMGNVMYMAKARTEQELHGYLDFLSECA